MTITFWKYYSFLHCGLFSISHLLISVYQIYPKLFCQQVISRKKKKKDKTPKVCLSDFSRTLWLTGILHSCKGVYNQELFKSSVTLKNL